MKIKRILARKRRVYYWDFEFLNYRGEKLLYCCVAPTFDLALQSFKRYTEFSPVTLLGCTMSEPFEMLLQ